MLERIPWRFVLPSLLVGGLLVVVLLALIGPVIGSVFPDITSNLEYAAVPYAPPEQAAGSGGELAALPAQAPRLIIYTVDMSLVVIIGAPVGRQSLRQAQGGDPPAE